MSPSYDTSDFIKVMSKKGFAFRPRKNGHLGMFLLDENEKMTAISSGVSLGGHGRELPMPYFSKIARQLSISPHELKEYYGCNLDQKWILDKLRKERKIQSQEG
jgi:hypothetical protein